MKLYRTNKLYNQGWRTDKHLRIMADIDGDGQADIVGFGNNGVMVSYSTGDGFTKPRTLIKALSTLRVEKQKKYYNQI